MKGMKGANPEQTNEDDQKIIPLVTSAFFKN
jgi:hypothetical protein